LGFSNSANGIWNFFSGNEKGLGGKKWGPLPITKKGKSRREKVSDRGALLQCWGGKKALHAVGRKNPWKARKKRLETAFPTI